MLMNFFYRHSILSKRNLVLVIQTSVTPTEYQGCGERREEDSRQLRIVYFVAFRRCLRHVSSIGMLQVEGMRRTYVIKSFLSFAFFSPPKAILVPGMYFLGFSRYSNYSESQPFVHAPSVALRTRVSSFHSMALFLFASVYEKPST